LFSAHKEPERLDSTHEERSKDNSAHQGSPNALFFANLFTGLLLKRTKISILVFLLLFIDLIMGQLLVEECEFFDLLLFFANNIF
jgi:hypothetical protein